MHYKWSHKELHDELTTLTCIVKYIQQHRQVLLYYIRHSVPHTVHSLLTAPHSSQHHTPHSTHFTVSALTPHTCTHPSHMHSPLTHALTPCPLHSTPAALLAQVDALKSAVTHFWLIHTYKQSSPTQLQHKTNSCCVNPHHKRMHLV